MALGRAALCERIGVFTGFFHVPDSEIDAFLLEDVPYGDLTTAVLGIAAEPGRITRPHAWAIQ